MRRIICIAFFVCSGIALGQIQHPKASPFTVIEQEVGLSKIRVEYSRPSMRGRKIFGDLVPYGRIWRVGANESTKFTTDTDLDIQGNLLPKGTYALYSFPGEKSWEVVFHTNTGHWGDGRNDYDPKEDLFRIKVIPESIPVKTESFQISFDSIRHNGARMDWEWENTRISIPIGVDTDAVMREVIVKELRENPTAQSFYEAARYFQEQGTDQRSALIFVNKALEMAGDTYYFHRVRSLILADLGAFAPAIESAKRSRELAEAEGKDEFVRMNEKNIALWEKRVQEPKK